MTTATTRRAPLLALLALAALLTLGACEQVEHSNPEGHAANAAETRKALAKQKAARPASLSDARRLLTDMEACRDGLRQRKQDADVSCILAYYMTKDYITRGGFASDVSWWVRRVEADIAAAARDAERAAPDHGRTTSNLIAETMRK